MKHSFIFGTVAAVVCLAPGAWAKSPAAVEQIARAVSVEMITGTGSGVVIHRQGDLYTVITNRHVVCTREALCTDRGLYHSFNLKTNDGRVHQVSKSAIKLLKDDASKPLDLAIVQFRSSKSYQVAQVADPGSLKVDDWVYTAGFPMNRGWLFGSGKAQAVANRRLIGDRGGYTVVYSAETLPGMSGGGAFDQNGRLVAVHGQGDRYRENTQTEVGRSDTARAEIGSKIGYNRGISVRWVVSSLAQQGVLLGGSRLSSPIRTANGAMATTADEFFIAGFNKFVDPGNDFQAGRKEAVKQFDRAVALNPRYIIAYFLRAYVKDLLNDSQGALADYNQVIALNPKLAEAYNNRGGLKKDKLNDSQGALADFNQAISLDPKFPGAYNNRGSLKARKLNDSQGALADYNQAISLDPKYVVAYNNRGNLKRERLNDVQGALADYNQAIYLDPKFPGAYNNRGSLKAQKLNDAQGALADYNQAISLNPKYVVAYNNRGALKDEKLNDIQGALADYNQAIALEPKMAETYANRGLLKAYRLNDRPGAIADLRMAAKLFRESGNTQLLQQVISLLRQLGAGE
jgi:tetratricopeptide (TPR) repeat protein